MNASLKFADRLVIIDTMPTVKHSRFIEILSIDPLQWDSVQMHTWFLSEVMIPLDLKSEATVDIAWSMDYSADTWIVA